MDYKHRRRLYKNHRKRARYRGIPWHFNYVTWWKKWCESGKWNLRGCHIGQYVMSRPEDKGPYASWNVKIIKCGDNIREARLGKRLSIETRIKMSNKTFSIEHRKRLSKASLGNKRCLGYKHTDETKEKMRQSQTGRKHSKKTKNKMREARKIWWKRRIQNG